MEHRPSGAPHRDESALPAASPAERTSLGTAQRPPGGNNPTDGNRPRVRLALDTCIAIAAQSPGEPQHQACLALFQRAHAGQVELLVSSTLNYDLRRNGQQPVNARAERTAQWLQNQTVTLIPAPFRLGYSRLNSGDALVSEESKARLEDLESHLASIPQLARGKEKKLNDLQHYQAAVLASADAFVTTDQEQVLAELKRAGVNAPVPVLGPQEAITRITPTAHT